MGCLYRFTGQQGKGEAISFYHIHLLHGHLDISRAITAGQIANHQATRPIRRLIFGTP